MRVRPYAAILALTAATLAPPAFAAVQSERIDGVDAMVGRTSPVRGTLLVRRETALAARFDLFNYDEGR